MSDYDFRFGGIGRLYGAQALARFRTAHVLVVGIGGVGSWVVEALARSGVGRLTLVDLDEVCVSNVNRQVPALDGQIGRAKVEVMAERARAIAPEIRVDAKMEFFTAETAERLLGLDAGAEAEAGALAGSRPELVVDAIDHVGNKVLLIARCQAAGLPVVVCGGAGGRRDPTAVRVTDLARVTHDRLTSEVRKRLRKEHGFPRGEKRFGIDCVCSGELPVFPQRDGTVCGDRVTGEPGESRRLNCDWGFGSASFVTGAFGFAAAARVLARLAEERTPVSGRQTHALPVEAPRLT
jgi:tRNA A37 threonylcarbamoyladenosine dehydratase